VQRQCLTQRWQDEPGLTGRAVERNAADSVDDARIGKPAIDQLDIVKRLRDRANGRVSL
jgi:hypothetical protein